VPNHYERLARERARRNFRLKRIKDAIIHGSALPGLPAGASQGALGPLRVHPHESPKHGSWLNVAEIELNVLVRQCLNRRIDNQKELASVLLAWQGHRDRLQATVNWQFTTADARTKLQRLYPTLDV
jgi:hypothetical protein